MAAVAVVVVSEVRDMVDVVVVKGKDEKPYLCVNPKAYIVFGRRRRNVCTARVMVSQD